MIKINAIQFINGKPMAMLSNGQAIPVAHIEGNVSKGKLIENVNGSWVIRSGSEECET